ncbi:hypothetical protein D3C84_911210 [compost metagenome]
MPGQALLDLSHHTRFDLSIILSVTIDTHLIGQEQPAWAAGTHTRTCITQQQPTGTTFQVRGLFRQGSLRQLLGDLVGDLAVQRIIERQLEWQHLDFAA